MAKEIKFSLLYRDMWQSSGKYVPRVDQLGKVAGPIVDMGCFDRVETNGGGFEQINLLFGENPNKAVRRWTQPFNDAGIQTHMLERGLNGIRMSPVPRDVRKLMFEVKKKQGTDIARSFDGLNDARNLKLSIEYAKAGGMIPQAALCITYSEIHTVEYYLKLADELISMGAEEICIKDMAGIGRPVSLGKIVEGIRSDHPNIMVQYHGHSAPGFSVASVLETVKAGAEYVDVAMEPLSWGTGHADLLTIQAMLKDAGYKVPEVNMKAYMEVRSLTQQFIDDFLGYYINPRNRLMNSLLIGPGLPGGMMGSLMADLENNLASLNKWLAKHDKPEISQDELLIKLFDEVTYIWPKMGYPPLVTPYSQYVKNVALMNVLQMVKGKERWSLIPDNVWDMMLGRSGRLPGEVAPELKALAKEQDREFFNGDPQDLYPDELDEYRAKMKEKGWDTGEDEEELLEYAMHPQQYEKYKSGQAKEEFEADLAQRKAEEEPQVLPAETRVPEKPHVLHMDINGEEFEVKIRYGDEGPAEPELSGAAEQPAPGGSNGQYKEITAPIEGAFYLTKSNEEKAIQAGEKVEKGDIVAYIESMKVYNAIKAPISGTVAEICFANGEAVEEDDVLIKVS